MLLKQLDKEFKIKTYYYCNIIVILNYKHLYNGHNIQRIPLSSNKMEKSCCN